MKKKKRRRGKEIIESSKTLYVKAHQRENCLNVPLETRAIVGYIRHGSMSRIRRVISDGNDNVCIDSISIAPVSVSGLESNTAIADNLNEKVSKTKSLTRVTEVHKL